MQDRKIEIAQTLPQQRPWETISENTGLRFNSDFSSMKYEIKFWGKYER